MKRLILLLFIEIISLTFCFSQFSISYGLNYSQYLIHGVGDNYFKINEPGYQLELAIGNNSNFKWVIWGISHFSEQNIVGNNIIPVQVWIPYYTEFQFYQPEKKNPLFWFFGYDYVRMSYPNMEMPDNNYNFTFGGGWNLHLTNHLKLELKVKPYFIIDNSMGQWFGVNSLLNISYNFHK